ncbi:MAG: hypothetical protein AB7D00_00540 [Rhodospirillaceae bacterium]
MILELRSAIADAIAAWFPAAECKPGPGRINLAELKQMTVKTPAVRVACLALPTATDAGDGETDHDVTFGVYILTTDKPRLPRDDAALAMVDDLVRRLPGQRWGIAAAHPLRAHTIKAENLYASTLKGTGLALWGVVWTQALRMGENAYPQGPVLSQELYAGDGEEAAP